MSDETEQAKLVRERLVVSDDQLFEELLGEADKLFKLDERGDPHPKVDISKMSSKKRVEFYLVSQHLANLGNLKVKNTASDKEMSAFLGISPEEVQRRASDLKGEGKVEVPERGEYKLVPGRIADVFRDLGPGE